MVAFANERTSRKKNRTDQAPVHADVSTDLIGNNSALTMLHRSVGNAALGRMLCSGLVHPKLSVSSPTDRSEQEADRIAHEVVAMDNQTFTRKVGSGSNDTHRGAISEKNNPIDTVNYLSVNDDTANQDVPANLESTIEQLQASGQPMDKGNRDFFEPRFGKDFSNVRFHTDTQAAETALQLNARAFTVGTNIFFGAGEYQPGSHDGKQLLAHELTHVLQQDSVARTKKIHKFDYKEHSMIGDIVYQTQTVILHPGNPQTKFPEYRISAAEMVALAGDYFATLDDMKILASTPDGRQQIEYARVHAGMIPDPGTFPKTIKDIVDERYYKLNQINFSHFSTTVNADSNLQFYIKGHIKALETAFVSSKITNKDERDKKYNEALLIESFHAHFLTDAFCGGHVNAPREAGETTLGAMYPLFMGNFFEHVAEHMANHINDNSTIGGAFATVDGIKQSVLAQVKDLAPKGASYSLGGLVSVSIHDWFNEKGLPVISSADASGATVGGGFKWTAYGENTSLSDNRALTQKDVVVAATRAGLQELEKATKCKTIEQVVALGEKGYAPEKFVPKADTSAPGYIDYQARLLKLKSVDDLTKDADLMEKVNYLISTQGRIGKMLDKAGDSISADGPADTNPNAAFKDWIANLRSRTNEFVKQIAEYVPGGTQHHYSTDLMSRDYVNRLEKEGKLKDVGKEQMVGIIDKLLDGSCVGDDEIAILKVLNAANDSSKITGVVPNVSGGFGNLNNKIDGDNWQSLHTLLKKKYFHDVDKWYKYDHVAWLINNTQREWGEEMCISVLDACTKDEFAYIFENVKPKGTFSQKKDIFDCFFDGREQDRFDELVKLHGVK